MVFRSMKMWRLSVTKLLVVVSLLLIIVITTLLIFNNSQPKTEVHFGASVFNVRVASDSISREKGLSMVENLRPNEGLLMIFQRDDTWGIWMKNMKIPIDIVWLNSDKRVVSIMTDASPNLSTSKTFYPDSPARYVLEISAGTVRRSGIKLDQTAVINVAGKNLW